MRYILTNQMDFSQKVIVLDQPPTDNAAFEYILYNMDE